MNATTQKLLDTEQTSINRSLRGLHDQSCDRTFDDTVTAIIVSVAKGNQVESRIIFFGGLLTSSKGNCLTRGDKTIGATVSLHWLFNTNMREKFRVCHHKGPFYAVTDHRNMEAFHEKPPRLESVHVASHDQNHTESILERFMLTFEQREVKPTRSASMSIQKHLPKKNLSLDMNIDGCQITMGLDLQTSPHCVVSTILDTPIV